MSRAVFISDNLYWACANHIPVFTSRTKWFEDAIKERLKFETQGPFALDDVDFDAEADRVNEAKGCTP